jgi:hypothetical protein
MTSVSQIEIFVNGTEVLKVVLAFCLQENLVPTLSFSHPDFTTQGGLQQKRDIHNALQHISWLLHEVIGRLATLRILVKGKVCQENVVFS